MQQVHTHSLPRLALAITAMCLAWVVVVIYVPVDQKEQRNAIALSKTGPRGQAAFRAAWSDGRLTRMDMYELREEAGHDVDTWIASQSPSR